MQISTEINSIYDLSICELSEQVILLGEAPYRAAQIWTGLFHQLKDDWSQFNTFSQSMRAKLVEKYKIGTLEPGKTLHSRDGDTSKTVFKLPDGLSIETVLMKYDTRRTLCISTQAGCSMNCSFCATGQMGFYRNLSAGEIVEQVVYFSRQLMASGEKVTNIVVMGMGEPFLNYDATIKAIDILNDPDGLNFGERRFTISTVGILPMIDRFTREHRQINLAISLHAATDELRSSLVPVNKKYPIDPLLESCRKYAQATNRRITFEWALIKDTNDSIEQAKVLASKLKGLLCHVNLIQLNPTRSFNKAASTIERATAFKGVLDSAGIPCSIRLRRGVDIHAGCGQLATQTTR